MSISTDTSTPAEDLRVQSTIPAQRPSTEAPPSPQDAATATAQIDLAALRESLSPAQRKGLACVQCGRDDGLLEPAGTLLDVKVVECYAHQRARREAANPAEWLALSACPSWCDREHARPIIQKTASTEAIAWTPLFR
ncbi:hypothetical protein ACBJ59_57880 [Nonomuraea sp. MTCD27]|uniref:hypothetical protein n=1 Tax=Nonomuraea sp. MTCD27 TaxID=1676747 RepID=UPI0035C26627